MTLSFDVKEHEDGWLLRDVLRARLVSASLLTQLKNTDGIRVDGAALRANERVHTGAHIVLTLPPERDTSVTAQNIPVTIAYESAHAAVLEKPAGMAVHPTLGYHDGTLGNAWMGVLETRGEEGVFRPVNRIDRAALFCAPKTHGRRRCWREASGRCILRSWRASCPWATQSSTLPSPGALIPSSGAVWMNPGGQAARSTRCSRRRADAALRRATR